jgi:hypothetical protein
VVVRGNGLIPFNLLVVVPSLRQVASEEHFDCLFYGLCIVQKKEHNEIDIATARRIQHTQILATDDTAEARVSVDGREFEEFLVRPDEWAIVYDAQKRIVVLCLFVDSIHIVDQLGDIASGLGDVRIVHRLVGVGLDALREQDPYVLLEIRIQNPFQSCALTRTSGADH